MSKMEIIERLAVRIKHGEILGSGVILFLRNHEDVLFILTAKHCIEIDKLKDGVVVQYPLEGKSQDFVDILTQEVILDEVFDLALLVFSRKIFSEKIDKDLPEVRLVTHRNHFQEKLLVRGYPKLFENEKAHTLEGLLISSIDQSSLEFEFGSQTRLDTYYSAEEENVKGLSGSGVFVDFGNSVELGGIVIERKGGLDTLICLHVYERLALLAERSSFSRKGSSSLVEKGSSEKGLANYIGHYALPVRKNGYMDLMGEDLLHLRDELFPKIRNKEAVLIIGPSIYYDGQKPYIGERIIGSYSKEKQITNEWAKDLIAFVDAIFSGSSDFSREEFDNLFMKMIEESPAKLLEKIASLEWIEIVTTNFDIFLEKAYDYISKDFFPVYNKEDYRKRSYPDQVRLVKLNGSLSDKKTHPMIISSNDFRSVKKYYKMVSNTLREIPPMTPIILLGFHSDDAYAQKILSYLESYEYQGDKWVFSIDPTINEWTLNLAKDKKQVIIKCDPLHFFELYDQWEIEYSEIKNRRLRRYFHNIDNSLIGLSTRSHYLLANNLIPLNKHYDFDSMTPQEFYEGKEPSFYAIKQSYDVVKRRKLDEVQTLVLHSLNNNDFVPIILFTGSYGTGKTTFTYRLIEEVVANLQVVAYELIDPEIVKTEALYELFKLTKANNFLIHINAIEQDSAFKSIFLLQEMLSNDVISDNFNIIIVSSIRENILLKHSSKNIYKGRFDQINIDVKLDQEQALELVNKLNNYGLVHLRDQLEKQEYVNKIVTTFDGEMLVSLKSLLKNSHHERIILNMYNQLTADTKKAFLFTSLLYRYNIKMPIFLLQSLLSLAWEAFEEKIIKVDGKGILIQEINNSADLTTLDFFFKTRHPIISNEFIKIHFKNQDTLFAKYLNLIPHLSDTRSNATLLVDLLKSIAREGDLSSAMLNKLFDRAAPAFEDNEHFQLQYAINLQNRGDEKSILQAISNLQYTIRDQEEFHPNHRILHRRGALSFVLARNYFKQDKITEANEYVNQARDFFDRKKIYDPHSSFSYWDYLKLEMWYLKEFSLSYEEELLQKIKIEDLLMEAQHAVFSGNLDYIKEIEIEYNKFIGNEIEIEVLRQRINDEEENTPYLLILVYYQYLKLEDYVGVHKTIVELESFSYLLSVARTLLKYYGNNLHIAQNRMSLYDLLKNNSELERTEKIWFNFFLYMASAYDRHWGEAFSYIKILHSEFSYHKNPKLQFVWKDTEGEPVVFDAIITFSRKWKGSKPLVKIPSLQQNNFNLFKDNKLPFDRLAEGDKVKVKLLFFFTGIKARIVDSEGVVA